MSECGQELHWVAMVVPSLIVIAMVIISLLFFVLLIHEIWAVLRD